ncbi:MAG: DUF882 domain-containing protein [Desulfuromonadales bacterium]|uniref:DUF882 domain-containing protein n=1 Tax=Desulfuromonas sp. KJ2020 TaxID=2919173 RepID=UPI0020A706A9|nr:DUF882 domain-containing protein [Desulfuromonas sp. KJ2020]MCP3177865.1 DUF882 domain-containing protein [Desulfuromonas sp. KJ2020]
MMHHKNEKWSYLSRRHFLTMGALSLVSLGLPGQALAQLQKFTATEKTISLHNIHTGERLNKAVFWANGEYVPETLSDIDYLLRDYRNGEVKSIDIQLLDMLHEVRQKVGAFRPYQVISGYRSPETNEFLARNTSGVASKSLHLQGQAIDIRLPGIDLQNLRNAALSLRSGGVGYYPKSQFVHMDTGTPRSW